jgi:hypothetical protein
MKIRVTRTQNLSSDIHKKVIKELSQHKGPLIFSRENSPLIFDNENYDWGVFFRRCIEYRLKNDFSDEDFLVVLTELKNSNNWFSGISLNGDRTFFVHCLDWENYIYSEPEYPISYEVVANTLRSLIFKEKGISFFDYVHKEPIGCTNDLCGWKPDITFKLRTGDICTDCLSIYSSIIEKDVIDQTVNIFEFLRKKMVFNKAYQKPMSFEENLPFSIAITKRKLGTTIEPFKKMLMLIDHFDSIVRTTVIMMVGITIEENGRVEFFKTHKLDNSPALGSWVNALSELSKNNNTNFPELQLSNDFSKHLKKVIQITEKHNLIKIRNDFRGHGYIESHDNIYKELFTICIPIIERIEQLITPLFFGYHYYEIIKLVRIESNKFKVMVHVLSGSNPAFVEKEIISEFKNFDDLPIEGKFYLVKTDFKKWINLDPFFQYNFCDICKHNRFLIYDGIHMIDPYIGHRFKVKK